MMEFSEDKPIYSQIADYCMECVLSGTWAPGVRIPSVRELAVELAVNTRTVMKAYEILEDAGVIISRRGMGYYADEEAPEKVKTLRRRDFFAVTLPALLHEMELLGITTDDLIKHIQKNISSI